MLFHKLRIKEEYILDTSLRQRKMRWEGCRKVAKEAPERYLIQLLTNRQVTGMETG